MLYYLFRFLEQFNIPGAHIWSYISFRAILALILSLLISAWFGEHFIKWMKRRNISETARDPNIDPFGVEKKGVPTMGGIIIIVDILVFYVAHAHSGAGLRAHREFLVVLEDASGTEACAGVLQDEFTLAGIFAMPVIDLLPIWSEDGGDALTQRDEAIGEAAGKRMTTHLLGEGAVAFAGLGDLLAVVGGILREIWRGVGQMFGMVQDVLAALDAVLQAQLHPQQGNQFVVFRKGHDEQEGKDAGRALGRI